MAVRRAALSLGLGVEPEAVLDGGSPLLAAPLILG